MSLTETLKYIVGKIVYGEGVFFDLAKWLIATIVLLVLVNTFFVSVFIVDGISMEPNLGDKEVILWKKNSFDSKTVKRGDVIVVNYPGDPEKKKYVKRIVGLPGERVDIYNGYVYINKELLKEDYLPVDLTSEPNGTWQLGNDRYFIMGDNRKFSNDSRYFGSVEERFILGQSLAIVFPRFRLVGDI